MATILGCSFGDLKQRDKERKNKRILNLSLSAGAVFLIFGIFMAAYHKAEGGTVKCKYFDEDFKGLCR